jgi:hypothetical protein
LGHALNRANAFYRITQLFRDLFRCRFATELLHQLLLHAHQFIDRLDHVHGNTNRARLIRNAAGDRLPNPPRGVGGKFIAAAVLKLLHSLHKAHVSFLNQIQERETAVCILLCDGNN